MNYYYNPVQTVQGTGSIKVIPSLLRGITAPGDYILLLVWNESVLELEVMKEWMEEGKQSVYPLCFTASNPTVEQLYDIYTETKQFSPKAVVAVGGGSVMDVGKSLCCLYGKEIASVDTLREIISKKEYGTPAAKWIGVPTTAGTGSEVTCWATIWDPDKNEKRSVESQNNYAYAAVVDPDLTEKMPVSLAVSSALDAMTHAVESYWAKGTNLVSKTLALGAIETIMNDIDSLLEGKNRAHERMAEGSMLAGLAFSNTKTTACHSISYPLTMKYQIPHGVAVSMLLAPVLRINQEKTENMNQLFKVLGAKNADELETRIGSILKRAGIPSTLEEWHVEKDKLAELAKFGITKGRADNNPVDITPEMIEEILQGIF